jgi:hypothetical protein
LSRVSFRKESFLNIVKDKVAPPQLQQLFDKYFRLGQSPKTPKLVVLNPFAILKILTVIKTKLQEA